MLTPPRRVIVSHSFILRSFLFSSRISHGYEGIHNYHYSHQKNITRASGDTHFVIIVHIKQYITRVRGVTHFIIIVHIKQNITRASGDTHFIIVHIKQNITRASGDTHFIIVHIKQNITRASGDTHLIIFHIKQSITLARRDTYFVINSSQRKSLAGSGRHSASRLKKFRVNGGIRTYNLPNTGRTFYPLSYKES